MISPSPRSPGSGEPCPLPGNLIPPKDKRTGRPNGAGRGEPDKEKDPGSTFGPESVPLATGSVSVVYWMPGPFPRPTPCPAGSAPQAPSAPCFPRRLRDEPVGPASVPGAGLQQHTADPDDVNREPKGADFTRSKIRLHCVAGERDVHRPVPRPVAPRPAKHGA